MGNAVLDALRAVADAYPDRTALAANGQTWSYADLVAQVDDVARQLGPRPGVVAVRAVHSPSTIIGLFGVWAAGGTYCPVDPAFPVKRRDAMLAAAGGQIWYDGEAAHRLATDATSAGRDEPAGTAYILFTSGSTGEPKPVLTPISAIAATVASLRDLFAITPADRVLQFASLNWDTCFEEILPSLTGGATLLFAEDAHRGSFPRFVRMVERERITVLDLPTAFWHELVHHLVEADATLPTCVRLLIIGGEACSPARLADWFGRPRHRVSLLNTYGCTETTLITHAIELTGPTEPIAIGHRLPHVVEYIGPDGELYVGGPSIATGYRGHPDATAARFVTHGAQRFFRTGDRVSRRGDGALVVEARIDAQIKVRGVRVDPGEVEAHIGAHPAVSAVAVAGVKMADHTVLAAYVVAPPELYRRRPGRQHPRLPAHPGAGASRPQSHPCRRGSRLHGERQSRSAPDLGGSFMTVAALADIFGRILGTPVDPDSDFFALGGDSLLATRVLSAIARESGVELTFDEFLEAPTPAGLAATVGALS